MITLIATIIKYSFSISIEGIEFISALFFVEGIGILLIAELLQKVKLNEFGKYQIEKSLKPRKN